ncbi:MAG TPA: serine/threonine-protein kinase [Polyangiaceae bacterium]|nr:serine/threonine-protein kinase [Polyangiaceae bacterium]
MSLSPGDIIDDKYRIVRLIGEGGMGAVYEGENARIHRRVAIKVLHAEVAANGDAVARFEREAQAAGRIGSDHIVEVLDLGTLPSGARYLVMEFMDGDSLSKRIKQRGKLSPHELYPIARQLLEALAAAHGAGIVHRDLKPDNVFLLASRHGNPDFVKLLDFGISKFSDLHGAVSSMTRTGAVMGTPYYMAPEQAKGSRQLDQRVDLYAVGVVMYEALTGKVPFDAETFNELLFKIVLETPRPIEELAPGMDPNLCAIVRRAMAREPNERFQTADEFRGALDQWAAGGGAPLPDASGRYPQVNPNVRASAPQFNLTPGNWTEVPPGLELAGTRNRKPLYMATAAIVLVVFGAGGFLLISGRESNREAAEAAASASALATSASAVPASSATAAASAPPVALPSETAASPTGEPSLPMGLPVVGAVAPKPSTQAPLVKPSGPIARPTRRPQAAPPPPPQRPAEPAPTTAKTGKGGRPIRTEL